MQCPRSSLGVPNRRRRKSRRGRDIPSIPRRSPPGNFPIWRRSSPQTPTPITRSISTGCSPWPKPAIGMEWATTRSKAATAIQKWSRATARICWPCTPLRSPRNEQSQGLRRRRIFTSASAVDLPYSQGDLKCRGRVGEVSCAFSSVLPDLCRRRRHARNPFSCTRCGQPAPVDVDEDDLPDRGGGRQGSAPSVPRLPADNASADGDQSPAATRITLRPHDPGTGEEIEKREVVKGYEYARGQFLTFTAEVRQHVRGTRAESGAGPVLRRAHFLQGGARLLTLCHPAALAA